MSIISICKRRNNKVASTRNPFRVIKGISLRSANRLNQTPRTIYNKNPLYAFIVNDKVSNSITTIKVKFLFLGLISTYALILSNSDVNLVNRYCEFVAVQRDVSKKMKISDWKWSYDEIGISLKSDNSSHSFIYFGTSKEDINYIKTGLSNGLRKETEYEKIEPELISLVIESLKKGKAVILYGDVPIIREETLHNLISKSIKNKEYATLLTAIYENPTGYGRIIRDEGGNIKAIVEEDDAPSFH